MIQSILEAVRCHAAETPDKLCMGDKDKQVSYSEFWTMIRRAAAFFKAEGIGEGEIVTLRACQKVEYEIAFFGLQLAGAVVCPLEKGIKEDRILEIMDFVDATRCVSERRLKSDRITWIRLADVYEAASDSTAEAPDFPLPSPDAMTDLLFTTGTTGKSKGIEVTAACNVAIAQNVNDSVSQTPDEVEIITTPVSHSLAIRRTYGGLYIGSSLVFADGVKFIEDFFTLLTSYKATALTFVPAILEQVLRYSSDRLAAYNGQLHYIQLGSAPLSEENKARLRSLLPDVRLYNTYGATESGCTIILEFSKYTDKEKCIGRTTVNTTLLFVDDERREVEATPEQPATMAFRGGMNMRRYYKEPGITAEVMDELGTIYTNDVGYRGADGLIYLLGRKGDVINVGGIKVAPTEVEEAAMKNPMLADCACIPIPDEITGEATKLFVVPADPACFDAKLLQKDLMNRLEALKVPKVYEVIDEIPRTFNGKIIRKQLKERR